MREVSDLKPSRSQRFLRRLDRALVRKRIASLLGERRVYHIAAIVPNKYARAQRANCVRGSATGEDDYCRVYAQAQPTTRAAEQQTRSNNNKYALPRHCHAGDRGLGVPPKLAAPIRALVPRKLCEDLKGTGAATLRKPLRKRPGLAAK